MIFSYYDFYVVKLSEFNRTSIIYTLVKDRRLYPYENFDENFRTDIIFYPLPKEA